jgi:hypothetical protein
MPSTFHVEYGRGSERFPKRRAASASPPPNTQMSKTKLATFTKNVIKSSKNLTIDVIGSYLPNVGSIGSSINQARKDAFNNVGKSMGKVKDMYGKISGGADKSETNPKGFLSNTIKTTYTDTVNRLKKGEFYQSKKEKDKATVDSMMGDFNMDDMSGIDIDTIPSGPVTSLSDEPFGVPLTSVEQKVVSGNARHRRNRMPPRGGVTTAGDSSALQLTLGDKLNADTVQYSATAIIGSQEGIFKRQFAADELRHATVLKYQEGILRSVNSISDYLQNVNKIEVQNSYESQNKILSVQEDILSAIKDLHQAVLVTSPTIEEENNKYRSKLSMIMDGNNSLNSKEYTKNVKGNIMNMLNRSSLGTLTGLTPLLGSIMGIGEEGIGKQKFDPLSTILRLTANSLISRETRGKLATFNNIAGNLGPLLIGQMNRMASFGNSPVTKILGQIFGVEQMRARKINFGVEDVDSKVNWSAKSDRTLNEVIPNYLSKMTAALTGGEETFYDYKTGNFRTVSSAVKERERIKETSWYNPLVENYTNRMASLGGTTSASNSLKAKKITEGQLKSDIDIITHNISFSGKSYTPENLDDKDYVKQLTKGIKNIESFKVFNELYNRATALEQMDMNAGFLQQGKDYDNRMLELAKDHIRNGGAGAVQYSMIEDERKRYLQELEYSEHLNIKGLDENSPLYAKRKRERLEVYKRMNSLNAGGIRAVNAVRINDDGSTGISGGSTTQAGSTSMVGILNNIYDLLGKGILVYPRKLAKNNLPEHLKSIIKNNQERAASRREFEKTSQDESTSVNSEILAMERELQDFTLRQQYRQFATISDILGGATGITNLKRNNPLNSLATVFANIGIKASSTAFNSGSASFENEGLFPQSQYERSLGGNSYDAMLNTLDGYRQGNSVAASVSGWLYNVIEKKKNKTVGLAKDVDPNKPFTKKDRPNKNNRSERIFSAVKRAYEKFYENNILRRNVTSFETSEEKTEEIIIIVEELKKEGFTEEEAINTVSQIIEEPIGESDTAEPVSENTVQEIKSGKKSRRSRRRNIVKESVSVASSAAGNMMDNSRGLFSENIPKVTSAVSNAKNIAVGAGGVILDKVGNVVGTSKEYIDSQVPKIGGMLSGFVSNIKALFASGSGKKGTEGIKDNINAAIGGVVPNVSESFGKIKDLIKGKFESIKSEKTGELNEDEQEREIALSTYGVLEQMLQEIVSSSDKEPTFDDIDDAVRQKIKEGAVDSDIADSVMKQAYKISKDGDKEANPVNAYYSAIYEMKESYNEKYRKDHSIIKKIIKKINKKTLVKGVAATTLLFTGHPIMAAMLTFGPKKTAKGILGGAKAAIKGSAFLAKLSLKAAGAAAKMAPGVMRTGLGAISKILSGDIFDRKPKKSKEELEEEREVAAMAFKALEDLHREIMEGNPDASFGDIKSAIRDKVKSGVIDEDIADAIIKVTGNNLGDKDADATPLGAFLQAILTLKKQYAKDFRKETSIPRKIAKGILKGAGKGIGAAALLLSGHPIMAAALALSGGPAKLMRSLGGKFAKKGEAIPSANPLVEQRNDIVNESSATVEEKAAEARSSILQKIPGIISKAREGTAEGIEKARGAVTGAFGSFKDKMGGFFQERREGSLFDAREDKKEARRDEVQEETLAVLQEIKENTSGEGGEDDEGGEGKGEGGGGKSSGISAAINAFIGMGIQKLAGKAFGALAGKGGVLGKIGSVGGKLFGAGRGVRAAGAVGKAGGLLGKLGGIGGKAGGLLGKLGGIGGKAGGLLGKAGGIAGKLGGLAKFAPALGGLAKFAGPVGIALTAAQAIGGGVKGWKNAANIAGLGEGQRATTGQKVGSAVSGGLGSLLTLGGLTDKIPLLGKLWNQDNLTKGFYKAGSKIGDFFGGKKKPKLDENGNPIIDPKTGQPVYEREGGALKFLARGGLYGAGFRGIKKLYDKNKAKKEAALDENGEPILDEDGNPVLSEEKTDASSSDTSAVKGFDFKKLGMNILKLTPQGLAIRGGMALGKKIGGLFGSSQSAAEPELDENGNPVIGPDGKPVIKATGAAKGFDFKKLGMNILKLTPQGLAIRGGMALGKKIGGLFGSSSGAEPELDENGNPVLGPDGKPVMKNTGAVTGLMGKIGSGIAGLGAAAVKTISGKLKKLRSPQELLTDILSSLKAGIIVFPADINSSGAPSEIRASAAKTGLLGGLRSSIANNPIMKKLSETFSRPFFGLGGGGGGQGGAQQIPASYSGGGGSSTTNSGYGGNNYSGGGPVTTTSGQGDESLFDPNNIRGPEHAAAYFYSNPQQVGNQIENLLYNGRYDLIEKLADNIADPNSMGQNKSIDSLSPQFRGRVQAFLDSPEARARGIKIREARRSPLTQLAYFTKGRAPDDNFIHSMFKKAGFSGGAWSPKVQNTQTLGSEHFFGNAVDLEDNGKGEAFYREIAPIAKKYGLEWGGDWANFKDYPHFQLPRDDKVIGYNGAPQVASAGDNGELAQRADGEGNRSYRGAMAVGISRTTTSYSPRIRDNYGTSTATSLRLAESPVVTSERELLSQIHVAINIQKAIHDEQKRHNNVAEEFFISLLEILKGMSRASSSSDKGNSISSSLDSLSAMLQRDRDEKESFARSARIMATGY